MRSPGRVLVYPSTSGYNPYLSTLTTGLQQAGYRIVWWNHFRLQARPDVVLLHWVDTLWVPPTGFRAKAKRSTARLLLVQKLAAWRRHGTRVIWFAHNRMPHLWDGSLQQWHERSATLFEQVDAVAHLTNASAADPAFYPLNHLPTATVRHPHYELVSPAVHSAKASEIRRLLFLGGLEPRKQADVALAAATAVEGLEAIVTGIGPVPLSLASAPNVTIQAGQLSEKELFSLFDGSTASVLTQKGQLNSGVLFLALSRGSPVIGPDSPTNRELSELVGPNWIHTYEEEVDSVFLIRLVGTPIPRELPDLSRFTPSEVTASLIELIERIR